MERAVAEVMVMEAAVTEDMAMVMTEAGAMAVTEDGNRNDYEKWQ